jgi:hypothetical protein
MDVSVRVFSNKILRVCNSCTLMEGLVFCSKIFRKYEWMFFSKKKLRGRERREILILKGENNSTRRKMGMKRGKWQKNREKDMGYGRRGRRRRRHTQRTWARAGRPR